MIVIIRPHKHPNASYLIKCPDNASAAAIVEKWQKSSIQYQLHGTLPPCTWKIAEKNGLVSAMIEGARVR